MIGYLCAYLRYYYPTEFVAAYLNNANNDNDIRNGTELANLLGIKIKPIKFRHSGAEYIADAENKVVYKGIASIKFFNTPVANQLSELRNTSFQNFADFLAVNPCDSRQTTILIKLNYFSEFGKSQYLLDIYDLLCKYHDKKIIKKDRCDFDRDFMLQFATETDKQYKLTDNDGFLNALCDQVPNRSITIKTYLDAQKEYLGYIDYVNPKAKGYGFVMSVETKYSPKLTIYQLDTGKTGIYKMAKKDFSVSGIQEGSIIKFTYELRARSKMIDGKWVKDFNEKEPWIEKFVVKENV